MDDLRPMLETILMRRISSAVSSLPDGGRRPSPMRADAVRVTVEMFMNDVNSIVDSEFRPYCGDDSMFNPP